MTFRVLFTVCSWLTAFSCFSLWLLEGSDILSLHSQSKIPSFSAHSNCVKRLSIHFYQRMEPCWGSSRSATLSALWAGRMHPPLPMPSSFSWGKGGLQKTPLIYKCSLLFIWGRGACLWFVVVVVVLKGKTKQHSLVWGSTRIQMQVLSISPPWSNTQQFVPFLISYKFWGILTKRMASFFCTNTSRKESCIANTVEWHLMSGKKPGQPESLGERGKDEGTNPKSPWVCRRQAISIT